MPHMRTKELRPPVSPERKAAQLRPAAAPYSEHNQRAPWLSNADCWCAEEFGLSDDNTQSGWRMIV